MGIKNLSQFIKKNYPECIQIKNISDLSTKTICIDTPCLLYKFKFTNNSHDKNGWLNNLIFFLCKMISNNINLWFVMEGKSPIEKNSTQKKRILTKKKSINRTKYLKELLDTFEIDNIITEELNNEWKILSKTTENIDIEKFRSILKKREKYSEFVTKEDSTMFMELLNIFNIPCINSETEAETLCCYLSNKVDYIYSHDTDVLAYINTKGLVNEFNFKNNTFKYINKLLLLEKMCFTPNQFIDLCILSGTDYNETVKKIGITTAFKYIKNYEKIENIPFLTEENINKLNYIWIREKLNFSDFNKNYNYTYPFCFNAIDRKKLQEFLDSKIIKLYQYIEFMLNSIYSEDDI